MILPLVFLPQSLKTLKMYLSLSIQKFTYSCIFFFLPVLVMTFHSVFLTTWGLADLGAKASWYLKIVKDSPAGNALITHEPGTKQLETAAVLQSQLKCSDKSILHLLTLPHQSLSLGTRTEAVAHSPRLLLPLNWPLFFPHVAHSVACPLLLGSVTNKLFFSSLLNCLLAPYLNNNKTYK